MIDTLIVGIIVAGAVYYTIRSFVNMYKGESACTKCSCSQKGGSGCKDVFPMDQNPS